MPDSVTPESILSVNQTIKRMPSRDSNCRALLRKWGIVRDMDGTKVVIWGDVLAKLRESSVT